MITSISPQSPQFAGKPNKKGTLLAAMLLGSAAGAAALPASNSVSLQGGHNNTLTDTFTTNPKKNDNASLLDKIASPLKTRQPDEAFFSADDLPPVYLKDDDKDVAAREILKKGPFAPTDINILSNVTYPDAKPMIPAAGSPADEKTIRETLLEDLTKRFKGDEAKAKKAVEAFDSDEFKTLIPNPTLRGSLFELIGTPGQSAIDVVRNGTYQNITFTDNYGGDNAVARVFQRVGQKPFVTYNPRYEGEDFRQLASTMAHEALHQDGIGTDTEEVIANALDIRIYAQQLLEHPELANEDTELTRRQNSKLMGWLNSMDDEGNQRLLTDGKKGNIFPGNARNFTSFGESLNVTSLSDARSTPGNTHLAEMLKAVTGQEVRRPSFNRQSLQLLDENQNSLKPEQRLKLAEILRLDAKPLQDCDSAKDSCGNPAQNNNGKNEEPEDPGVPSGAEKGHTVSKGLLGLGLGASIAKAAGII